MQKLTNSNVVANRTQGTYWYIIWPDIESDAFYEIDILI